MSVTGSDVFYMAMWKCHVTECKKHTASVNMSTVFCHHQHIKCPFCWYCKISVSIVMCLSRHRWNLEDNGPCWNCKSVRWDHCRSQWHKVIHCFIFRLISQFWIWPYEPFPSHKNKGWYLAKSDVYFIYVGSIPIQPWNKHREFSCDWYFE